MKPLERTFEAIALSEPQQSLRARVLVCIAEEQVQREKMKRWTSIAGISISFFVFMAGSVQYGDALFQSDFWTLLSLLWSDFGVLVGSFRDFSYSLLETLPIVPIMILLLPLIIFFWSLGTFLALVEKKDHGIFGVGTLA